MRNKYLVPLVLLLSFGGHAQLNADPLGSSDQPGLDVAYPKPGTVRNWIVSYKDLKAPDTSPLNFDLLSETVYLTGDDFYIASYNDAPETSEDYSVSFAGGLLYVSCDSEMPDEPLQDQLLEFLAGNTQSLKFKLGDTSYEMNQKGKGITTFGTKQASFIDIETASFDHSKEVPDQSIDLMRVTPSLGTPMHIIWEPHEDGFDADLTKFEQDMLLSIDSKNLTSSADIDVLTESLDLGNCKDLL